MREPLHSTSLRIEPALLAKAKDIAERERRPLSNVLRILVELGVDTFEKQNGAVDERIGKRA